MNDIYTSETSEMSESLDSNDLSKSPILMLTIGLMENGSMALSVDAGPNSTDMPKAVLGPVLIGLANTALKHLEDIYLTRPTDLNLDSMIRYVSSNVETLIERLSEISSNPVPMDNSQGQ